MDTAMRPFTTSRSALRVAVAAFFFMAGLCFASWASRIPAIQQSLGLSKVALGGILLAIPTGLMCSLPFTGWIITRIGSRKLLIASVIVYGICLTGLGYATSVYELVACLWCFGYAGNSVII